jgi:hypothetical protein
MVTISATIIHKILPRLSQTLVNKKFLRGPGKKKEVEKMKEN